MAIDDLLDEHEQGERVRDWVRRNGAGLVGGVVLGLALIGGWKWWEARAHQQRVLAGEAYQATLEKIASGDLDAAAKHAAALDGGIYAALAALDLAKAQVDAEDRDAAIATLRGVAAVDPALARIVDQRLARLLIDAGSAGDALQMLGEDDPLSLEIRGDAQVALGKPDLARKEYEAALTRLDVAAPQRRLLEIKLTDVGGVPAQPEA
jgi:predicted negative regulator of RcsB-dependent stress response